MVTIVREDNRQAVTDGALAGFRYGDYFEVAVAEGRIVLTPIRVPAAETIREKPSGQK